MICYKNKPSTKKLHKAKHQFLQLKSFQHVSFSPTQAPQLTVQGTFGLTAVEKSNISSAPAPI